MSCYIDTSATVHYSKYARENLYHLGNRCNRFNVMWAKGNGIRNLIQANRKKGSQVLQKITTFGAKSLKPRLMELMWNK